MDWIWLVLGVLLVAIVAVVLYAFFVVRPRTTKQITASLQVLVRETHGHGAELLAPAKCLAASAPATAELRGLGVLGLTAQGLVFAAADPDRSLIIPRDAVVGATAVPMSGAKGAGTGRLDVHWRLGTGDERSATFATAQAADFAGALSPSALG